MAFTPPSSLASAVISGTVAVSNFPATQPVSIAAAVAVTGPLTDAQLRATPVPISGTVTTGGLTDAQLRATPVPVSGPLTDAQLRAAPVPISGSVSTGGLTDAELRATPVPVSGTVAVSGVAGTVLVDGSAHTQPISAASLPLPDGAATDDTLTEAVDDLAAIRSATNDTAAAAILTDAA